MAWACEALRAAGAGEETVARVHALIMATARHDATDDLDTQMVVDIDLAILGAEPDRFAQYERQVSAEYAAVPAERYLRKRRELLTSFLTRPVLYRTPELRARLEAQAQRNLERAVERALPASD